MNETNNVLNALDNEYKSLELYNNASSIYGASFAPIVELKQSHITTLSAYLQNAGVAVPSNVYANTNFGLSGNLMSDLTLFIQNENDNIAFYNTVIDTENDISVKDSFYLFQAHSYNDILPALQSVNLINSNNILNEITKARGFLNEAGTTLNKLQNNELSQAELEGFLSKLNFSLIGGAMLGAITAFVFNEISNQQKKE